MSRADELLKLYDEAINACETWRLGNRAFTVQNATPNELHLYNVFTHAQASLREQRASIEDAVGVYMRRK